MQTIAGVKFENSHYMACASLRVDHVLFFKFIKKRLNLNFRLRGVADLWVSLKTEFYFLKNNFIIFKPDLRLGFHILETRHFSYKI